MSQERYEYYGGSDGLTIYTTCEAMKYHEKTLRVLLSNIDKLPIGIHFESPVDFFILRLESSAEGRFVLSPEDSERVTDDFNTSYSLGEHHLTINNKT